VIIFLIIADFFLLWLVILSHTCQAIDTTVTQEYPRKWLNTIVAICSYSHMSGFTFLSGHLSKPNISNGSFRSILERIIWPFFATNIILGLILSWINNNIQSNWLSPNESNLQLLFFTGITATWYLRSLFTWRLIFPMYAQFKRSLWLPISLIFALLAGYDPWAGWKENNYRTIQMFPIFLLGHLTPRDFLKNKISSIWIRISLLPPVLGYILHNIFYAWNQTTDGSMKEEENSWQQAYGNDPYKILWRLFYDFYAIWFTFTIIAWMPRFKIPFFTDWGQRTMYPYLLHQCFLIVPLSRTILPHLGEEGNSGKFVGILLIAFIFQCIFSTNFIRWFFWPLIEPNFSSLFQSQTKDKGEKSEISLGTFCCCVRAPLAEIPLLGENES